MLVNTISMDGEFYHTINMNELNYLLSRSNNVMFFLNLRAFCDYNRKKFLYLIKDLSEENIGRIFFESTAGVNLKEEILETIIIPAFVWCIKNSKMYLITPYFRLLDYGTGDMNDIVATINTITDDIANIIIDDLKYDYIDMTGGMSPFVTYENADDIEENLLSRTKQELVKFTSPNVKLFISGTGIDIPIDNIFSKALLHNIVSKMNMALYELGYELDNGSRYIDNEIALTLGL